MPIPILRGVGMKLVYKNMNVSTGKLKLAITCYM